MTLPASTQLRPRGGEHHPTRAAGLVVAVEDGREREALALAAEGLSDRAVAARLFVTERTVEAHVMQIFQKLGPPRTRRPPPRPRRPGLPAPAGASPRHVFTPMAG